MSNHEHAANGWTERVDGQSKFTDAGAENGWTERAGTNIFE